MHRAFARIEVTPTPLFRVDRAPWAAALNQTAATDDITVTLLAFTVVDEVIHVSGLLRLLRRSDMRLSSVPTLTLATLDGAPLELLRAHALPNGSMFWLSWTFGRPTDVCSGYQGRIDRVDLAYNTRSVVREAVPGPWVFAFNVPKGSEPSGRSHAHDLAGEA
jgi:hypothetical protein